MYSTVLFFLYHQSSCILYEVKSLNYLRKKLRNLNDNNSSFLQDVKGDSDYLNYYYTTLYLGKDKTPQTYILDTGSSITTSPCDKCYSCGNHLNKKFKLENETNIISCDTNECNFVPRTKCKDGKCSFDINYSEGSEISGFYVHEEVFFEMINNEYNITNISYKIPIGCTTLETHLFKTQLADGIMGLNNNDKSFVSMLYNLKVIQKNIFTLCFSHEGGYFSIGNIFSLHHLSKNITYINIINKNSGGNHYMQLEKIIIGNKSIQSRFESFIDSGTTLTYFPPLLYNKLMNKFLEICKNNPKCGNLRRIEGFGYCAKLKNEDEIDVIINEGWMNITFILDGKEIIWTPKNYNFIYNSNINGLNLCVGFDSDRRNNVLLGTTFMHGFDIIFDRDNDRMGFVPADCNRNIVNEDIDKYNIENLDTNNIDINNIETDVNKDNKKTNNLSDNTNNIDINNIETNINEDNIKTNNLSDNTSFIVTGIDYGIKIDEKKVNSKTNNEINNNNIIINQTNKIIDIKIGKINKNSEIPQNSINITDKINLTKINDIKLPNNLRTHNVNTNNSKSENDKILENNINSKSIIEDEITFDKFMIKFSICLTCIVFIIFIIFNIILCRENYIYIQNKKNNNNIIQYELIPNEDFNIKTLFNDSI